MSGFASLHVGATYGHRHHGVAPGGPFDTESSRLANALVANSDWCGILELALVNGSFEAESDGWMAFVGGGHSVVLEGATVHPGSSFFVRQGQTLEISPNRLGLRAYLATPGGWSFYSVPGSPKSVVQGEILSAASDFSLTVPTVLAEQPASLGSPRVRFVPTSDAVRIRRGTVTAWIDRVGLRIQPEEPVSGRSMDRSVPSIMGRIQATPNGEILIHGPDGPTIGGYEALGTVVTADTSRLGQLRPGESFEFESVSDDFAYKLAQEERARISAALATTRPKAIGPL